MKFLEKVMFVLVKLEFRQKIKCQTSLKREGKLPVEGRGFLPEGGEGEKGENP